MPQEPKRRHQVLPECCHTREQGHRFQLIFSWRIPATELEIGQQLPKVGKRPPGSGHCVL